MEVKKYYWTHLVYKIKTTKKIPVAVLQDNVNSFEQTADGFVYSINQKFERSEFYDIKTLKKVTFDGTVPYATSNFEKFYCIDENYQRGLYDIGLQKWVIDKAYDKIEVANRSKLLRLKKSNNEFYANANGDISDFSLAYTEKNNVDLLADRFLYFETKKDSIYDLVEKAFLKIPAMESKPDVFFVNGDLIMVCGTTFYNLDKEIEKNLSESLISFYELSEKEVKLKFEKKQKEHSSLKGLVFSVDVYIGNKYGVLNEYGDIINSSKEYTYILPMLSEETYAYKTGLFDFGKKLYSFKIGEDHEEELIENENIEYYTAVEEYEKNKGEF
ncbi:hypothetical protein [Flammeovirga aprica]|uniref:Uncharacterized protein n=1 Tax=Flammeovirga aprica JL-4 TaxID=694437 RepID=A0A7X9S1H6_9BACT|nr:hypothetical protein [Flammeovirga aprica]NME72634.1 hypothetical protein [Flammeovirga aprica JL-4]